MTNNTEQTDFTVEELTYLLNVSREHFDSVMKRKEDYIIKVKRCNEELEEKLKYIKRMEARLKIKKTEDGI